MSNTTLLKAVSAMLLVSTGAHAQSNVKPDYSELPKTFEVSDDPVIQQRNFYHFIWRSFIALNWPNVPLVINDTPDGPIIISGLRGQPNKAFQEDHFKTLTFLLQAAKPPEK